MQAKAERIPMGPASFGNRNNTEVTWIGGGGAMINSRGTVILIDPLLPIHWGCVDAPEWKEFNGDPEDVRKLICNPDRLFVKAVGEPFVLPRR